MTQGKFQKKNINQRIIKMDIRNKKEEALSKN